MQYSFCVSKKKNTEVINHRPTIFYKIGDYLIKIRQCKF